jgi:transposase
MQLRYSFRLYPSAGQRASLARAFGCARVVYNDALRARETARAAGEPFPKAGELSKMITEAKTTPERAWLGEVSAVVLQQSLRDLEAAYRNFFDALTGKRPKTGAPRFKSRKDTAGHPVHRQRPVEDHAGRRPVAAEDRGGAGEVVPRAALAAVHGDGGQGRRRAVLRQLRHRHRPRG